eukprot:3360797-Pyramimonas_sp.AAC.1
MWNRINPAKPAMPPDKNQTRAAQTRARRRARAPKSCKLEAQKGCHNRLHREHLETNGFATIINKTTCARALANPRENHGFLSTCS